MLDVSHGQEGRLEGMSCTLSCIYLVKKTKQELQVRGREKSWDWLPTAWAPSVGGRTPHTKHIGSFLLVRFFPNTKVVPMTSAKVAA